MWLTLFIGMAMGQTFTARLSGVVSDAHGAPAPDAKVTALQTSTGAATSTVTDSRGTYVFPLLAPGTYEIAVEKAAFQKQLQRQVVLEVNSATVLPFRLAVASVSVEVQVTDEAPVLQTESGGVGTTVDSRTIDELPLVQRDVMAVVRLAPGVIAKGQVGDARGGRGVFNSNLPWVADGPRPTKCSWTER